MKKYFYLLFLAFLGVTNLNAQCADQALVSTSDKCMSLVWTTPPSPLPASFVKNGETYNLESGLGTSASPAVYRKVGATGSCGSEINLTATIYAPNGTGCVYTNGVLTGVLPIKWLDVKWYESNYQKLLYWKVEELNVKHYQIYGSKDGISFEKIVIVSSKGNGTNEYQYSVGNVYSFYKIEKIGLDGVNSFSNIIKISNDVKKISIAPNPASTQFILYNIDAKLINTNFTIYNQTGQQVMQQKIMTNMQNVNISELAAGYYFIKTDYGSTTKLQIVR
jgi:hypothetical protein